MSIVIGKPYYWNTAAYGRIAVHVTALSPNGAVAVLSIDGGEASTPAQRFPELSDGIYFGLLNTLSIKQRVARTKCSTSALPVLPTAEEVRNVSAKEAVAMLKPARKPRTRKAETQEVTF